MAKNIRLADSEYANLVAVAGKELADAEIDRAISCQDQEFY